MVLITFIADRWMGLCRKPPVICPPIAGITLLQVSSCDGSSGGDGPGAIGRGIGAALAGISALNRNRQLLWFALLAGLVLAGNAVGHAALYCLSRYLQPASVPAGEAPGSIIGVSVYGAASYSLEFALGFATLFCLVYLFAALISGISSRKDGAASFSDGIGTAGQFLKPIILWSLILASAVFLLDRISVLLMSGFPQQSGFLFTIGDGFFISTITQFPFNWTLDWNMLTEIPGYGGRSLLLLVYPFGFLETLHFSAISLLLFGLTPFAVPRIVLAHASLREAVTGSFSLVNRVRTEAAACILFLGVIASGIFLTYLLVQAGSGIVSPYETITFHPPATWVTFAFIYDCVLAILACIMATIAGIAVLDLYREAADRSAAGFRKPGT